MKRFFLGVIVGAVLVFGAQRYHIVRAKDGVYVVPKLSADFNEAYVDIREFGVSDWANHKELAAALVKAQYNHLLEDSAAESFHKGIQDAINSISGKAK